LACLNGAIMPADEARVPVWDRGFLFGDAVYEVFRLYEGRCWLEDEHLARLRRSLAAMEFPPVDLDGLMDRLRRTTAASGGEDGFVTEATHSSVLWVREGTIGGTPEGPGILPGTTRRLMLRLAADAGIAFDAWPVTLGELVEAPEVFMVGTTIEVLPVVAID